MAFDWDEAAVERMKRYHDLGHSAREIANMIGAPSKNAVIGKLHRLGVTGHPRAATVTPIKRKPQPKVEQVAAPEPVKADPPLPAPRRDLPTVVARLSFDELEHDNCRFPVGEPGQPGFGFCGQKTAPGQPYCPTCCQRAYAPETRVSRPFQASFRRISV